jgi:CheY-like chemotaxis protein
VAFKPTLWQKLLILFTAVGLAFFVVLGLLSYYELRREKLSAIEANLNGQLKQLDMVVGLFFFNIESGVKLLVHHPDVGTRNDEAFTNFTQAAEPTFKYNIGLDTQLPETDGFEVASRLRSDPALTDTPIIAVTSYALVGDREKAIEAGCTSYIEKPINPDTFISQIYPFLAKPTG